jgi:hypothetical protein
MDGSLWQLDQEEEANSVTVEEVSVEIDHDGMFWNRSPWGLT